MEFHDEATLLFEVHDESVRCPAERCKLHERCFGWLAVTPSAVRLDSSQYRFLPSRRSAQRGLCRRAVSVCPSVHLSHTGIVSKQLNLS